MDNVSSESTHSLSALPLTPRDGAEEILLARLTTVSLGWYGVMMRYVYRLATFNHPEDGPLLAEDRRRFLESLYAPRTGAKSPPFHQAKVAAMIREEVGLPAHHPLTSRDTQRWLRVRERAVRDGARTTLLDPEEKDLIAPAWAVECFAACLDLGPVRTRALVEAWGRDFADGLDGFRSKKASGEAARDVPTPKTVNVLNQVFAALFRKGAGRLRKRYADDAPEWLRPWPGDWEGLTFTAHEMATAKRRQRVEEGEVRTIFERLDAICAEPFLARFGMTDLDVAADPRKFWDSFEDKASGQTWLRNKNITLAVRDRAIALLAVLLGERGPELSAAQRGDLVLDGFTHPAIAEQYGVYGPYGSLFVRASAKADATMSAHDCPLPQDVCRRLRVLMFLYNVLREAPLAPSDPLILSSIDAGSPPRGLTAAAIRQVVGRVFSRFGDQGAGRKSTGYNAARRYTDQAIHGWFEEWRRDRDGIHERLDALTVKEVTLGHSTITVDPHTYSGLSDDDGRFLLSLYGAEVVIETIFGRLGRRMGPDRKRIESELAAQRAFEQSRGRVASELAALADGLVRPGSLDRGSQDGRSVAAIGGFLVQADQRQALTERIAAQERIVNELLHDRDLWVVLSEGERRLSKRDLRALSDSLLGTRHQTYPPVRDFVLQNELEMVRSVDSGTIRAWCLLERPEDVSHLVPWIGRAPVHKPNERTTLFAAAALDELRIGNPDRWMAIRRLLARWPSGRGWDPRDGAKTKCVRDLARAPITLARPAANDLLASASEDCVRIFEFEP